METLSKCKPSFSLKKMNCFNLGEKAISNKFVKFICKTRPHQDLEKYYVGTNMAGVTCRGITNDALRYLAAGNTSQQNKDRSPALIGEPQPKANPNLIKLVIGGTAVTDDGLKYVAEGMKTLNHLAIWMCPGFTATGEHFY